jgi:lipopolysaccharide biosynthesis glycosyltransferase
MNVAPMNIAFCINRFGLVGLGVTLSSLIRNCSAASQLRLWFVSTGLTQSDRDQIGQLLKSEDFFGSYEFIAFDPLETFGSFCSLHGDWTTYGRLLLADLLAEDQVLYLDADLVVELDVLQVKDFDFAGSALAAVGGGKFKYTLGSKFYLEVLGIAPDTEYFNAGVLLLNLREWRESQVKEQCLRLARQHPQDLPSHDQSLLNILLQGHFAKLPAAFNCEWAAYKPRPAVAEKMILHYVGSPKPWDPLGVYIHNGYATWIRYQDRNWSKHFGQFNLAYFGRVWRLRRSYTRCVLEKIKN